MIQIGNRFCSCLGCSLIKETKVYNRLRRGEKYEIIFPPDPVLDFEWADNMDFSDAFELAGNVPFNDPAQSMSLNPFQLSGCLSSIVSSTATTGVDGSALPLFLQEETRGETTGSIATAPSGQVFSYIPQNISSTNESEVVTNFGIGNSSNLGLFPNFSYVVGDSQNFSNSQTTSNSQKIHNLQAISGNTGLNWYIGMFLILETSRPCVPQPNLSAIKQTSLSYVALTIQIRM